MDDGAEGYFKQCLYLHLQDLVEIDWYEVNTILKDCYTLYQGLVKSLNRISNFDAGKIDISDSAKNICRHLSMDMACFYENQWAYVGGSSTLVYENLKAKYIEIEECYLKSLSHKYARDTVFNNVRYITGRI